MAQFYNKILKKEEELGGYNIGEPDDDIFKIGDSDYPGDINEFLITEPEIIEEIQQPVINDEPLTETINDSNIWENYEIDIPSNESNENEDLLHSLNINDEIIEQDQSISDINDQSAANINQILDNEIEFDDEFKKRLAAQIRPENITKDNIEDESSGDNVSANDFKPVEDITTTNFIDISSIDISRPSENSINPENQKVKSQIDEQPEEDVKPKKNAKQKTVKIKVEKTKVEKPKKDRKKIPFLLFGIIAASILILSAISFYIYNYISNKPKSTEKISLHDSTKKEIKKDLKKEIEKPKEVKPNIDSSVIVKKNDSLKENVAIKPKEEKKDTVVSLKNTEKKIDKEPIKKIDIPAITKIEKKPLIVKKKEEKIAKAEPLKIEKKSKVSKEIIKVEPKQKTTKKDIVKNQKLEPKTKAQTEVINKTDINTKNAVYAVQVYSSPSKEDALEWLNKLKGKNISDGFISVQMVRDVRWYRVRFGQFESREQARSAALRYGFAQTWIDRVK